MYVNSNVKQKYFTQNKRLDVSNFAHQPIAPNHTIKYSIMLFMIHVYKLSTQDDVNDGNTQPFNVYFQRSNP